MGLPTVLPKPRTRSRTLPYTYARLHEYVVLKLTGEKRRLTCRLSDCRSERISVTREKSGVTRASAEAITPVVGTMLVGCTYTGRSPSLPSANRCVGLKFRSMNPA